MLVHTAVGTTSLTTSANGDVSFVSREVVDVTAVWGAGKQLETLQGVAPGDDITLLAGPRSTVEIGTVAVQVAAPPNGYPGAAGYFADACFAGLGPRPDSPSTDGAAHIDDRCVDAERAGRVFVTARSAAGRRLTIASMPFVLRSTEVAIFSKTDTWTPLEAGNVDAAGLFWQVYYQRGQGAFLGGGTGWTHGYDIPRGPIADALVSVFSGPSRPEGREWGLRRMSLDQRQPPSTLTMRAEDLPEPLRDVRASSRPDALSSSWRLPRRFPRPLAARATLVSDDGVEWTLIGPPLLDAANARLMLREGPRFPGSPPGPWTQRALVELGGTGFSYDVVRRSPEDLLSNEASRVPSPVGVADEEQRVARWGN